MALVPENRFRLCRRNRVNRSVIVFSPFAVFRFSSVARSLHFDHRESLYPFSCRFVSPPLGLLVFFLLFLCWVKFVERCISSLTSIRAVRKWCKRQTSLTKVKLINSTFYTVVNLSRYKINIRRLDSDFIFINLFITKETVRIVANSKINFKKQCP